MAGCRGAAGHEMQARCVTISEVAVSGEGPTYSISNDPSSAFWILEYIWPPSPSESVVQATFTGQITISRKAYNGAFVKDSVRASEGS
jgi:hypothetical protein